MAEPDHGDRPVTSQNTQADKTDQRRRVRRPAGPPVETGREPKPVSERTPIGKSRPGATPVKSAPLSRKRRNGTPAKPVVGTSASRSDAATESVAEPGADAAHAASDEVTTAAVSDPAAVAGPADDLTTADTDGDDRAESDESLAPVRVSYRERRAAGRGATKRKTAPASGPAGRVPARVKGSMRGLGIALLALLAIGLISAMAVASTLFVMGSNKIDNRNEQRAEYSAFARQIITNLTTLNPQNIDASIKSFQDNTSGKAMEQTGQSMEQTVNMIKSENVSTKGTVISDAVTASDADSATVIMVSSWEMNQPNVPDQQTVLQTFRWRLDITKINGAMKLTNFEWVT
jgi:Mce-associated membrane protein